MGALRDGGRVPAAVRPTITQLALIDTDGQEFRYHAHRDGTPTLPGIDRIDVGQFHVALLGAAAFLSAVADLTDRIREVNDEIAREYTELW